MRTMLTAGRGRLVTYAALALVALAFCTEARAQAPGANADAEGTLRVQYEDYDTGARLRHFLDMSDGRRVELRFQTTPADLLEGSRVRVRGRLVNGTLELSGTSDSLQTVTLALPNTFGEQQTLVMLIKFQDNPTEPYAASTAQSVTFTKVSNYYRENTYQQTWLAGQVVGWVTIAANSTTCATGTWASLAEQAATNAGVNVAAYSRRIYAFPKTSACSWWGLGTVGGSPSRAWINGTYALQVVGHELGHNFGDHHSHSVPCNSNGCSTVEYGDHRDIMGNVYPGHMNAFQKERLGWLNYGSSPPIQTVSATNNYWIEPLSTAPAGNPKALKILKAVDSYGRRTWYYVETHAALGFDSGTAQGVSIHTGSESSGTTSNEIDQDPVTTTFKYTLAPGQSYSDPAIGLVITTMTADSSGALLQVSLTTVCTRATPTVSLAPSATQWGVPGATVSWTVTVKNNDSSGCAAATFALSNQIPAGWTAAFSTPSVLLQPGQSGSAVLQVVSPATATSGSYSIVARADAQNGRPIGYAIGTYAVASNLNVTLNANVSGRGSNQTINAAATVSVDGAAAPGVPVTFTATKPDGEVLSATIITDSSGVATGSYKIQRRDPPGIWTIVATATMGSLTGSATTTVQIQ